MSEQLGSYFHVGVLVEDIDLAMEELGKTLGLHFNEPHDSQYGPWKIRVSYSREGPPYVELVQGERGGPWDITGGPRADHLGYFTDDLDVDKRRLEAAGMPIDIDGTEYGGVFTYHRSVHSGLRVELIDASRRDALLARISGRDR
jgi:hypothetical protein